MCRHLTMALLAGGLGIAAVASPVAAQERCPEGRTLTGKCVDAGLAAMNRERVIAFTQSKFSYTSPPFLPREDRILRVPPNFHEVNNLYTAPAITTTVPGVSVFYSPVFVFVPTPRP
jgi:hypothetical protein